MTFLRNILVDLLGDYTPVTYIAGETEVVANGFAGVDWPWVASAVLFILVVYAIFRLVRCLIAK